MKRLIIVVAVLLAIGVAADAGARVYAEHRVGRQLRSSLGLSRTPSIGLGGFPFLTHAIAGHLASVTVRDASFSARGWAFQSVVLRLQGVRFSPSKLFRGASSQIQATSGAGTVVIGAAALTTEVQHFIPGVEVNLAAGQVSLKLPLINSVVPVRVRLQGQNLVVEATFSPAIASVSVPLPTFLPAAKYTGVRVDGSALQLDFVLESLALTV